MSVVTRFAPSPTGDLHIGGARTALFSWLFARANGGKFLLRIEDTDRERSTQEAVQGILDGLDWLKLQSDEPPVYQSERSSRHAEVVQDLVERGAAYRCYVTAEELETIRAEGAAARERLRELKQRLEIDPHDEALKSAITEEQTRVTELTKPFRSPFRNGDLAPPDKQAPFVVRLKMPDEGDIVVDDAVQGQVKVPATELDDMILLRSDGTPTYMLAVVVDDHDMGVTNVIRGDDHFRNTFRQLPIYHLLGWEQPTYAHIPLIHGADGKKLSKRHGAQSVMAFRDLGYLPEGVKNYLLRLGWSHGDHEIIPEEQAIAWFGLDGLNKAPARLDFDKLNSVNGHYMAQADETRLAGLLFDRPEMAGVSEDAKQRIAEAMAVLKTRAANLVELVGAAEFLKDLRPIELTGKRAKLVSEEARNWLKDLTKRLELLENWAEPELKNAIERYCAESGVGIGKIGPVVRAVLTGGAPSPDLAIVLTLLGRNESLARLNDFAG